MTDKIIYRKATQVDMPEIMKMQADIFHGEQGIPLDAISEFTKKNPTCWCAELDGKICAAVAAWNEDEKLHWGRFVVTPEMRNKGIGKQLARVSFDDIFSGETDEIYMEAREITVHIVCSMGGKVVGKPVPFFKGTVTPVVLSKKEHKKGM